MAAVEPDAAAKPVLVAQSTEPADNADSGVLAAETFDYSTGAMRDSHGGLGWQSPWRTSRVAAPVIAPHKSTGEGSEPSNRSQTLATRNARFRGTAERNNPLRRQLEETLTADEAYLRFDFTYEEQIALRASGDVDPEFFILWLDRLDGGDTATHADKSPNLGVNQAPDGPLKGRNVFMARVGTKNVAWSEVEFEKGREYRVVGRLRKRPVNEKDAAYIQLDLWIDPAASDFARPDASLTAADGLRTINWIGFATAKKTEATDNISVSSIVLGETWESVVDERIAIAALESNKDDSLGHNGVVWDKPVSFGDDVYPVFKSQCFDCHAGENPYAGHRLDVQRELLGYSSGEVLAEPGRGHDSRLIHAVSSTDEGERMPPDGADPLTDEQIAMLKAWIDQGMAWDDELLPPPKLESAHWAFQPVARPDLPESSDGGWVRTPVDAFIAAKHESAGLRRAEEASKRTLARRLYLDLLGLPPTPEEVNAFLNDESPDAYEKLVERLLDSPHYGERWARYWLDLARWAESQGYQHDIVRPFAWRYRDYVINSFNEDKPYDQFLKEQLAGDELTPYTDEHVIATGFLGAARISGNEENRAIQRNDVLVDIVNTTGSALLGLTMECAQCHNHKFDPISQRDYYSLQGFFVRGQLGNLALRDTVEKPPSVQAVAAWMTDDAHKFYANEVKSLTGKKLYQPITKPHTWGFLSAATGHPEIERLDVVNRKPIPWRPEIQQHAEAQLLIRGDPGNPAVTVNPAWPEVLGGTPSQLGERRRSALADWMADRENPLVSRVWVNRLWQHHFGRGIVETENDFGVQGSPPTHPQLLDWLAAELIDNGWSTKHIHRLIVLSATYRQQSAFDEANARIDPDNQLMWRWPRRRLEAEAIRDSALVASGELRRTVGGASVPPRHEENHPRRTLYSFQKRSDMPDVMAMFDGPNLISSCGRRAVSTVPLQPLYLLNSPFMANRAEAMAARILDEVGDNATGHGTDEKSKADANINRLIAIAFERALCRPPDAEELALAQRMLTPRDEAQASADGEASDGQPSDDSRKARLARLCLALLNLNEFVYLE